MSELIRFHFDVDGQNFSSAGEASVAVKKKLRQMGYPNDIIRKVSVAMYEGEINMVIHAGGGEADIEVGEEEIVIILRDRGPGIPEDKLEKVLEPWFRVENSRNRETGGSGLGLAIAKNMATLSGAQLSLRNREEGGLCARIRFPA